MKTIDNVSNGVTVQVQTFESEAEFMEFLQKNPVAQSKALFGILSQFRYHVTNSVIAENVSREKKVLERRLEVLQPYLSDKPDGEEVKAKWKQHAAELQKKVPDAVRLEVPTDLAKWLLEPVKARGEQPTDADKKMAANQWAKIQLKLDEIANRPDIDSITVHQQQVDFLNLAANHINLSLHKLAQLPTLEKAFDDDYEPNEHPFDQARLAMAFRTDRVETEKDRQAKLAAAQGKAPF